MSGDASKPADTGMIGHSESTELSAQRTAMSFERTAMSAHRTLHAVMKSSLSLISFGFTIFKFFTALSLEYIGESFPQDAARNFGMALLVLGVLILAIGMVEHYQTMASLRARKHHLHELGLVHSDMPLRIASSMFIAFLLLAIGILGGANLIFSIGPS